MEKDFFEIIRTRRSCRSYRKEQTKDEELKAVLEAGTYAPTSRGKQAPFIVAVQNEELLAHLAKMNAEVMGVTSTPYYDAPTSILVEVSPASHTPFCDGRCVLENMMLAANALGLGTCWNHNEREMFETEEGKQLLKEWGIPENVIGVGALAIGYPDGEPSPAKPRKEGYYRIIK